MALLLGLPPPQPSPASGGGRCVAGGLCLAGEATVHGAGGVRCPSPRLRGEVGRGAVPDGIAGGVAPTPLPPPDRGGGQEGGGGDVLAGELARVGVAGVVCSSPCWG